MHFKKQFIVNKNSVVPEDSPKTHLKDSNRETVTTWLEVELLRSREGMETSMALTRLRNALDVNPVTINSELFSDFTLLIQINSDQLR